MAVYEIRNGIGIIPEGTTAIRSSAFKGNKELTGVIFPSSVKVIGDDAFSGCSCLESIVIPSSVEEIGGFAFSYCERLADIRFEGTVDFIGPGVFKGGPGQVDVDFGVLKGKTIAAVRGMGKGSLVVLFYCTDGTVFQMYQTMHLLNGIPLTVPVQVLEDFYGAPENLLGSVILKAEEGIVRKGSPELSRDPWLRKVMAGKISTRCFYRITTERGRFRILWHGKKDFLDKRESPYFTQILAEFESLPPGDIRR